MTVLLVLCGLLLASEGVYKALSWPFIYSLLLLALCLKLALTRGTRDTLAQLSYSNYE